MSYNQNLPWVLWIDFPNDLYKRFKNRHSSQENTGGRGGQHVTIHRYCKGWVLLVCFIPFDLFNVLLSVM